MLSAFYNVTMTDHNPSMSDTRRRLSVLAQLSLLVWLSVASCLSMAVEAEASMNDPQSDLHHCCPDASKLEAEQSCCLELVPSTSASLLDFEMAAVSERLYWPVVAPAPLQWRPAIQRGPPSLRRLHLLLSVFLD